MKNCQSLIEGLILPAGIRINGNDPSDITVYDERFYNRVLRDGSLGLGESYMDGWWDCKAPDRLLYKLLSAGVEKTNQTKPAIDLANPKGKTLQPAIPVKGS